jgi:hypothetical protein
LQSSKNKALKKRTQGPNRLFQSFAVVKGQEKDAVEKIGLKVLAVDSGLFPVAKVKKKAQRKKGLVMLLFSFYLIYIF